MALLRRPVPIGVDDEDYAPVPVLPEDDTVAAPAAQPASDATESRRPVPIGTSVDAGIAPVVAAPKRAPIGNPQMDTDTNELNRLKNSKDGISQIKNPFLRGLARVGDIAGSAFFPGITAQIPGTALHHSVLLNEAQGRVANDIAGQKEQAQTDELNSRPELKQSQLELAQLREQNRQQAEKQKRADSLRAHGFKEDENNNIVPLSYEEMSQDQQAVHDLKASQKELTDAKKQLTEAQKSNMPVQIQMAQQRIATAQQNASTAYAKLGLQNQEFERDTFGTVGGTAVPGGPTDANGQPVGLKTAGMKQKSQQAFDSAYVKPARDVEKSWQMMDTAYREYQDAKKQGKELPTGAQSMVALSTHLSTTFGNVKGARITKDMIEHHLGARGVSDSAVVAVQKLTNGDTLSPDQWQAFHQLIKNSRDLSWKGATAEAQRKGLPVDFLPQDLQQGGNSAPKPQGQKRDPMGIF